MANATSSYRDSNGRELLFFLDIDLKSELVIDFYFKGDLALKFQNELEALKNKIINSPYKSLYKLEIQNQDKLTSIPNWLIHKALDNYKGSNLYLNDEKDYLCLCFGVRKSDLKKEILNRPDYDLSKIISETMATSGCGSCRGKILDSITHLREQNGLIAGLTHAQSRTDKNGNWIKIKSMYPADLIIKLDELKINWMKREAIENDYQIEIKKIEGYHLWISVSPNKDQVKSEKILQALSDFWRSELRALFFLHLLS